MEIKLNKGEVLFNQGDRENKNMYIVVKGKLTITKLVNDASINCGFLQEGAIFGEMSMILGDERAATISAQSGEVVVRKLDKKEFLKTIKSKPELAWNIMVKLANKTKKLDDIEKLFLEMNSARNV